MLYPVHQYISGLRRARLFKADHGLFLSIHYARYQDGWQTITTIHASLRQAEHWLYRQGYRRLHKDERH